MVAQPGHGGELDGVRLLVDRDPQQEALRVGVELAAPRRRGSAARRSIRGALRLPAQRDLVLAEHPARRVADHDAGLEPGVAAPRPPRTMPPSGRGREISAAARCSSGAASASQLGRGSTRSTRRARPSRPREARAPGPGRCSPGRASSPASDADGLRRRRAPGSAPSVAARERARHAPASPQSTIPVPLSRLAAPAPGPRAPSPASSGSSAGQDRIAGVEAEVRLARARSPRTPPGRRPRVTISCAAAASTERQARALSIASRRPAAT